MVMLTSIAWLSSICMVMPTSMAWLSSLLGHEKSRPGGTLGILAFDAARTMSRFVSLYKSLSDEEFFKLKYGPMKSKGLAFLMNNSKDEAFLFNLVYSEKLQDLNCAATTVSRLARKCSDVGLNRFDLVYADMKRGAIINLGKIDYNSKIMEKTIKKMERYVAATRNLHSLLESLREIESSEKKLPYHCWQTNMGPTEFGCLDEKTASRRKQIQHCKEISLWSQSFEKTVGKMARTVSIVYARICVLFAPFVPSLPCHSMKMTSQSQKQVDIKIHPETDNCLLEDREKNYKKSSKRVFKSSPIHKISEKSGLGTVFYSSKLLLHHIGLGIRADSNNNVSVDSPIVNKGGVLVSAQQSTVGGAGLTLPYSNVIIHAETYLHAPLNMRINQDAREHMYNLLPWRVRTMLKGRMKSLWYKDVTESDGHAMAEGWKNELKETMGWLAKLAHDTIMWQNERNLEKHKLDPKSTVLLLQTLHYADLEKTEAAIVEILVGLSCIHSFQNRQFCGCGSGDGCT